MANKAIKMKDIEGNSVYPCPYYPVGSIYMSVNNINPAEFFGGEWEQIEDKFLLACGSNYKAGAIGGSNSHKIKQENLPARTTLSLGYNGGLLSYSPWTGGQVGNGFYNSCLSDFGYTSDQSINHMPPYLAVYIWKRTA